MGRESRSAVPGVQRSAASSNVRIIRAKQLRTTARNRSFFVPNNWKTYGWETPTRRAIASVDAPTRPPVANSSVAAATIASRRSSAVIRVCVRVAVLMATNLGLTKNVCQVLFRSAATGSTDRGAVGRMTMEQRIRDLDD